MRCRPTRKFGMLSGFLLCCVILVLLATTPAEGVSVSYGLIRNNGNIKSTSSYADQILKHSSTLDSLSGETDRTVVFQLDSEKTPFSSDRQSVSEGGKPTSDDAGSASAENSESGSIDTENKEGETQTDSSEQSSAVESAYESPLDTMFIEIKKPGLGSPLRETVFKDRALTALFNNCVIDPADPSKEDTAAECYVDDAYNDRLTFSLTFRFPAAALELQFKTTPPSLKLLGDSSSDIAEPSFLTQNINKETSTGEISIAYGCKSTSSGTIALELTLHFGEGEHNSTSIRWKKACANQQNRQIEFGYLVNEKDSSDLTRVPFPSAESPLVVAPNDVSTEVYMKLGQAGAQQTFLAPYITSGNPDVTPVTLRGNHPSGGVLEGLELTTLQVNYDCRTKGASEISLNIGIPPFDNLTAVWKKDCGGRKAMNLQVGTSEGSHDVVENGNPTPRFMVAIENIGTAHSDAHLHLPGNQSDWTVYIRNSETDSKRPEASEAALHIGSITLTIEHPETVAAQSPKVSSRGMTGWSEEATAEHLVAPGESLRVSFHFLCRALGESRVLITVPILQYDTLEFGIAKECTHIGKARQSRELVWTVENVFGTAAFAALFLVAIWWWRRRRAAAKGFEALPVTDR